MADLNMNISFSRQLILMHLYHDLQTKLHRLIKPPLIYFAAIIYLDVKFSYAWKEVFSYQNLYCISVKLSSAHDPHF